MKVVVAGVLLAVVAFVASRQSSCGCYVCIAVRNDLFARVLSRGAGHRVSRR